MIDPDLQRMYAEGALNTYMAELSEWIAEKEASIQSSQHKTYLAPALASLQKHVDEMRSLLSKAENFHASRQGDKPAASEG